MKCIQQHASKYYPCIIQRIPKHLQKLQLQTLISSSSLASSAVHVACLLGSTALTCCILTFSDCDNNVQVCQCESTGKSKHQHETGASSINTSSTNTSFNGNSNTETKTFFEYFPQSQLFQPKRQYPAWDDNWDLTHNCDNHDNGIHVGVEDGASKCQTTRHILLIRHGQYDETFKDDSKRKLTKLGREQAHLTGQRLAQMINGIDDDKSLFQPCHVKTIRVSDMTRAKETAAIIATYLPNTVVIEKPDPLLNEGIPAQIIPQRPELDIADDLAKNGPRIEQAFKKYFYRHAGNTSDDDKKNNNQKHEFEIIVCHGNVIRYFFCRALQLPPEAWLRMSTFNCSLTYLMIMPNGRVSCRMLGDIGHLDYGHTTFSMNHGFVW